MPIFLVQEHAGDQESAQNKEEKHSERSQMRVGSPRKKDRVTDHRIGLTKHNLPAIMDGALDDIIEALRAYDQAEALKAQAGL